MYEGTYKSRTKESGFSWGVVAELIGQLIDSGKYLPKEKRNRNKNNLHKSVYLTMLPIYPKNNMLTKAIRYLYLLTSVYHSRLLMRLFVSVPMIPTVHLILLCSFVVTEVQSTILNFLKTL